MSKPTTKDGYLPGQVELVRQTCLYLATYLGDLRDDFVVIGGLVPSLIVDQGALPDGAEAHVGTMDLDVGLTIALLDDGRYHELTERLRYAGFEPDVNDAGKTTRQRWRITGAEKVTVDFLIPPSREGDKGGRILSIESDFAAVIAPGLAAAFRDRQLIRIEGRTIRGELATREIWACGPGAYVVLKALAFSLRGENKDAYDLFYLVRNYRRGPVDVAAALAELHDLPETEQALAVLRRDFAEIDQVGPRRVAEFVAGGRNDVIQAEVVAYVSEMLDNVT